MRSQSKKIKAMAILWQQSEVDMISVSEALDILNRNMPKPRAIQANLTDSFGRRLAENIIAPESSPRYRGSAMDGYAVRWADIISLEKGEPASLVIVGESQAGIPYSTVLQMGEAIRISTGAVVPEGADTVIRVEDTEEQSGKVIVKKCKKAGQDVRQAGEEFQQGDIILPKGQVLKAREIALLSAVGLDVVSIYDAPQISLLITGTELARQGDDQIEDFQVRDSNAPMLQSAVLESGGRVAECIHVKDDLNTTVVSMSKALEMNSDIILCSGGVSVGRHDHVKEAAEKIGFEELFWKIKQKPGKPLFAAKRGETLLFGLPGNPVSAYMCFQNYVLPSLAAMQGVEIASEAVSGRAEVRIENKGQRTNFLRVVINKKPNEAHSFAPVEQQGSHMLTSIVKADGYVAMLPGAILEVGDFSDINFF